MPQMSVYRGIGGGTDTLIGPEVSGASIAVSTKAWNARQGKCSCCSHYNDMNFRGQKHILGKFATPQQLPGEDHRFLMRNPSSIPKSAS